MNMGDIGCLWGVRCFFYGWGWVQQLNERVYSPADYQSKINS
ncbi:hypothetical protein ATG71_4318 [Bacillus sp. es.034]|nr:hypothetical protein ATG71_4318 [Bacillus sp. es.034]